MSKLKFQFRYQEAIIVTEGARSILQRKSKKKKKKKDMEPRFLGNSQARA